MKRFIGRSFLWVVLAAGLATGVLGQASTDALLAERYFGSRQYDKAILLYERLYKNEPDHPQYALRVAECLQRLDRGEDALKFIERALRRLSDRLDLQATRGELLEALGQREAAEESRRTLVASLRSYEQVLELGNFFALHQRYGWAEATYLQGRKLPGLEGAFGTELATVYATSGQAERAAAEWVDIYRRSPALYSAARQQILRVTTDASAAAIERVLSQAVNAEPTDPNLRELLYDFYLLRANYPAALTQARVLDRQKRENGQRLYQLALTLQQNAQYALSNKALEVVIAQQKGTPMALSAFVQRAKNFELGALARRPIDSLDLRRAVATYDSLFAEYGRPEAFAEAMLRKARLCVHYTYDLAAAQAELEQLVRLKLTDARWAEAQLLLGDIRVMQADYANARLIYEKVVERLHEAPEGAQAKLRDARLAFFKGDFLYAKARLQVLKDNPSDAVSNDAIRLFLLIQDNLGVDSTTVALLPFARAQLLNVQRRFGPSLRLLDSVLTAFAGHAITDDVLWEKAQIYIQQAQPENAIGQLDLLLERYDRSVLADDALFAKAELIQYELKQPERAQELYLELLTRFPSSLLGVEARKRIRALRGDAGI